MEDILITGPDGETITVKPGEYIVLAGEFRGKVATTRLWHEDLAEFVAHGS